jgi:cytochrome c biogenesis protein CcdA
MLLVILSLIAGFLSVLAPCVLPLLPIIIGGSLSGNDSKKRPYIIVISLVLSLILFTLLLKVSTVLIGLDPTVLNYISGGIVIALGLVLLFPLEWDKLIGKLGLQVKSQKLLGDAGKTNNRTLSAVLTGLALGPVFSSCSPMYAWIVATVLPGNYSAGIIYLAAYSTGLAIALLGIALLGKRMIDKIKWASNPHGLFQKVIAVLFILVGLAVATGFDKDVQAYLLEKDFLNIKNLEEKLVPEN